MVKKMSFVIKQQPNLSLFWQNVFFHIWTLQVTIIKVDESEPIIHDFYEKKYLNDFERYFGKHINSSEAALQRSS